ncbi:MAG TPA: hypothetical protein EYG57_13485, partial [Planctomycetes bacterium]|nr:hypothetical protein [Planctomycetota bacterium]
LGFGKVKGGDGSLEHAVKEKGLYSYLVDDEGNWTERQDVRNVRVMGSGTGGMRGFNNEWMTITGNIGPEIGIGHHVGHVTDAPVMILKSCIGNRGLGWDLLPPGSEGFEFTDDKGVTWVHPGYKGSPERWEKGTEPKRINWYAGMQYDGDIARAKKVLAELDKYYPGAKEYEIKGFFWWQGDRDSRSAALSNRYEKNLVHLIKQLRKDFNAPHAKFVCASLGQTEKGATDGGGKILDAILAVDGKSRKYSEFKGNVASVYSHPLSKGSSSGSHYGGNAETYMNIGEAMGEAMVKLLKDKPAASVSKLPKNKSAASALKSPKDKPLAPASGASVTIDEAGFEADGTWKFGQTGAGVNGFFGKPHADYINAGLIDPVPGRGINFAYNNGPQHDMYQVLEATLAANTTYTLSIVAIDTTFANPFPGGKLRLGYVSESSTETEDDAETDAYGLNLLKPTKVVNPTPFNDKKDDPENLTDGFATWMYTFTTGDKPVGLGQKLRIEVLGGGKVQTIFDDVRLEARAATPAETESAARAAKSTEAAPVVVMLGDSTTDGGMPQAVQKQLEKLIASEHQRPKVINAGKGGDNATNALERLEKDVLAHKPDIVTVSFGLNDVYWCKPDEFKASLTRIIGTLQDANIQVLLLTSTPFNNERHGWGKKFEEVGGLDEYMDTELCEKMRSLADGKEVLLCDLHAIFKAEFKKDADLINKLISTDGVHLTAEGYVLVAKHVAPNILKLLNGK